MRLIMLKFHWIDTINILSNYVLLKGRRNIYIAELKVKSVLLIFHIKRFNTIQLYIIAQRNMLYSDKAHFNSFLSERRKSVIFCIMFVTVTLI